MKKLRQLICALVLLLSTPIHSAMAQLPPFDASELYGAAEPEPLFLPYMLKKILILLSLALCLFMIFRNMFIRSVEKTAAVMASDLEKIGVPFSNDGATDPRLDDKQPTHRWRRFLTVVFWPALFVATIIYANGGVSVRQLPITAKEMVGHKCFFRSFGSYCEFISPDAGKKCDYDGECSKDQCMYQTPTSDSGMCDAFHAEEGWFCHKRNPGAQVECYGIIS